MITLCLACNAKATRTQFREDDWPELLRILWREQHPKAKAQKSLDFTVEEGVHKTLKLFYD